MMVKKKRNSTKIFIRLEKNGKYIQKRLTKRMICDLFDLQFMMDDVWTTVKLNKMDTGISNFFEIVERIHEAMHEPILYSFSPARHHVGKDKHGNIQVIDRKEARNIIKMKGRDFTYGRPKWKPIKKR